MRKALTIWFIGVAVGFFLGWLASSYSYTSSSHTLSLPMGYSAPEAPIRVYFSPSPEPERAILHTLYSAQKFVYAALYQLTDPEIADALLEIARRGIELKILLDDEPSKGSKGCLLLSAGIAVKQYVDSGIMHHKFAVVDGERVLTGSYNWTTSAQTRNEENLLVIESPHLAQAFESEFSKLWTHKKAQALSHANCSSSEK